MLKRLLALVVAAALPAMTGWTQGIDPAPAVAQPAPSAAPQPPSDLMDPTAASAQMENIMGTPSAIAEAPGASYLSRVKLADMTDASATTNRRVAMAEFENVTFADAARELSTVAGINIAFSSAAGNTRVALRLKDLGVDDVLETLCNANGLWFRREPRTGVVRVFTVSEFRQDLVNIREEKTEVFTLLYPNIFDIAHTLQDLFGDRMVVNFGSDDTELTEDLQERFSRFDMVDSRSQGIGTLNSSSGGGSTYGSSSISGSTYSRQGRESSRRANIGSGLVSETGLSAEQIQSLQKESESGTPLGKTQQESTKKLVERHVAISVSVLRRQNKLVVRTADEQALEEIRKLVTQLDVPTSLVLLEVKVLSIELGNDFNSAFDAIFARSEVSGSFSSGTILPPTSVVKPVGLADGTGLSSDNLIFQYIGNNFSARMQFLETKNRVTQLATPILLTANNEVSRIFVGEERPINRTFSGGQVITSGTTTSTTSAGTDIEFVPVGTALLITPSINADRTVTLRILQENSSINVKGATILVPENNGFQQQQVDVVQSRRVSGTFIAKDRMFVAVGGLISEGVRNNNTGIPILSSIPGLGQLFRRDDKGRSRSELVVIIRPFILNTPAEAERVSRELVKQLSLHPISETLRGTLNTYGTNDVPHAEDSRPFAPSK
jgi:general secretion pathway protein D